MIKAGIRGFTLVELLIAMSIFFILVASTYAPYNYYTKKANLSNATKEISQSIYSARNMAINWANESWTNRSIWLYFNNNETSNNFMQLYSYPHNIDESLIVPEETGSIKLIKNIPLPQWIQIDNIENKDNALFLFSSISWSWSYYFFDPIKNNFALDEIGVNISYKWATWDSLKKKVI